MARTFLEQRLPPLQKVFVHFVVIQEAESKVQAMTRIDSRSRSRSFGGYVPYVHSRKSAEMETSNDGEKLYRFGNFLTMQVVPPTASPQLLSSDDLPHDGDSPQLALPTRANVKDDVLSHVGNQTLQCSQLNSSTMTWPDTDSGSDSEAPADYRHTAEGSGRSQFISLDAILNDDMVRGQMSHDDSTMQLSSAPMKQMVEKAAQESRGDDPEPFAMCSNSQQRITTLMIRNLPLFATQQDLIHELDTMGFAGLYDFCYAPSSFLTGQGKGFAFVNLTSEDSASEFLHTWHGSRRFGIKESDPPLNISIATLQGFEGNVAKWSAPRMRRVRNPNFRPFVATERTNTMIDLPAVEVLEGQDNSNLHAHVLLDRLQQPARAAAAAAPLPVGLQSATPRCTAATRNRFKTLPIGAAAAPSRKHTHDRRKFQSES
eukprot:gnl/TRDRNA2_/TRDRNA2_177124_c0_seq1.p1 gnl/TRDRNA2_/TRDRNA2_177124_c0~~gnl/TRDRNA2_/TRDRNA2_177124_c0_seq1.p1  ORF type:complete len:430 (-),score=66.64 gnl/TRDRNA2_/TRDRNA2_177124_c0_seq1:207-1496(-)